MLQFILSDTETTSEESASETSTKTKKIKDTDAEFCQLFSLPNSECPVSGRSLSLSECTKFKKMT